MPIPLAAALRMRRALVIQRRFLNEHLAPVLQPYRTTAEQTDWKKLSDYYALAVPAVIGEAFALLRGAPLSEPERHCLTFLGALSPVLDDFFDRDEMTLEHIQRLVQQPVPNPSNSPQENLFCSLAQEALCYLPASPQTFQAVQEKVMHAQRDSRRQFLTNTPLEDLLEITLRKGGHAFELYHLALSAQPSELDQKLAFTLGAAMQLENDLFDLWKDRQEGVRTACLAANSVAELRGMYSTACSAVNEALQQMDVPDVRRQRFAIHTGLVLARGRVCLEFLERQESDRGGFSPYDWPREALVCDLDTPRSVWKSLRLAKRVFEVGC